MELYELQSTNPDPQMHCHSHIQGLYAVSLPESWNAIDRHLGSMTLSSSPCESEEIYLLDPVEPVGRNVPYQPPRHSGSLRARLASLPKPPPNEPLPVTCCMLQKPSHPLNQHLQRGSPAASLSATPRGHPEAMPVEVMCLTGRPRVSFTSRTVLPRDRRARLCGRRG
jgi:hypothetical protein